MAGIKRKSDGITKEPDAKKTKANASITSFFGQPKVISKAPETAATATAPAAKKFDKEKWVESLSAEEKDLLSLEIQGLHESWLAHLSDEVRTESFLNLKRFLVKEHKSGQQIFPPPADLYSW